MYGFSNNIDPEPFIGAELTQVCIGANEIILHFFPEGVSVTIFDVAGFLTANKFMFDPLLGPQKRIGQIGKTIEALTVLDGSNAVIRMSDGSEILLKDDSKDFEAVTFQHDGIVTVV